MTLSTSDIRGAEVVLARLRRGNPLAFPDWDAATIGELARVGELQEWPLDTVQHRLNLETVTMPSKSGMPMLVLHLYAEDVYYALAGTDRVSVYTPVRLIRHDRHGAQVPVVCTAALLLTKSTRAADSKSESPSDDAERPSKMPRTTGLSGMLTTVERSLRAAAVHHKVRAATTVSPGRPFVRVIAPDDSFRKEFTDALVKRSVPVMDLDAIIAECYNRLSAEETFVNWMRSGNPLSFPGFRDECAGHVTRLLGQNQCPVVVCVDSGGDFDFLDDMSTHFFTLAGSWKESGFRHFLVDQAVACKDCTMTISLAPLHTIGYALRYGCRLRRCLSWEQHMFNLDQLMARYPALQTLESKEAGDQIVSMVTALASPVLATAALQRLQPLSATADPQQQPAPAPSPSCRARLQPLRDLTATRPRSRASFLNGKGASLPV